ncbi:hypothetical protein ADK76_25750 [Streptomyces griseoflavus]|nr:hypothetical protein ADK76_25750 [Streptomyces griseoflavus]
MWVSRGVGRMGEGARPPFSAGVAPGQQPPGDGPVFRLGGADAETALKAARARPRRPAVRRRAPIGR